MGMTLFWKECVQNMKSLTYLLYVCCMILFFVTQLGETTVIQEPKPGQESYGTTLSDDKDVQMKCALTDLMESYMDNRYTTYPLGFYKEVQLNETEQTTVERVLETLSGKTIEELKEEFTAYQQQIEESMIMTEEGMKFGKIQPFSVALDTGISYQMFIKEMKQVDQVLGGGSRFTEERIKSEAYEEMTYEQAKEEYQKIIEKDKVSGAYARLFCDYFGIMLAIMPVFLAVTRAVRDRRAKALEVIGSKEISSVKLLGIRYLAAVTAAILPVVCLAVFPAMQASYLAKNLGAKNDFWMYGKYLAGWLLPSVLFSVSAGFFFSELFGGAAGILIMCVYWLISLFQSGYQLTGTVGWNLIPRFNSLGKTSIFESIFLQLVVNRAAYAIAAIFMMAVTIWIYDKKRKGRWIRNGKYS